MPLRRLCGRFDTTDGVVVARYDARSTPWVPTDVPNPRRSGYGSPRRPPASVSRWCCPTRRRR
ncbi:hypothetical protein DVS28_a4289 [Euzebya pacifica]|uniref:Uncharacterized protein n=1 Tax=Euzebya pacifica TaxID=1608957 RepID=A0A346Y3A8_9ACTN|nr:hypothetical protein DVS28_a4289 [Euzebya pacifica]